MVLQPSVWAWAAVLEVGRRSEMFPQPTDAILDVLKVVPVRVPGLFSDNVWEYAVPNLAGWHECSIAARGSEAILDVPRPLGLGVCARNCSGLGCAVQLWLLQLNAYIIAAWPDCHGVLQAADMVRVLPDGHNDARDLQTVA